MIKPTPRAYKCPQCGWQKTIAPKSDVITPADFSPSQCPKCKCTELMVKKASKWSELFELGKKN